MSIGSGRFVRHGNLLEASPGHYKITDFGIAKWTASTVQTATGVVLGTPAYIAPELLAGIAPSPSADLYALAIVLHELATGTAPLWADGIVPLFEIRRNNPPPPLPADWPPRFAAFFARALAPSPAGRFADAGEFAAAWEHAGEAVEAVVAPGARSPGARPPASRANDSGTATRAVNRQEQGRSGNAVAGRAEPAGDLPPPPESGPLPGGPVLAGVMFLMVLAGGWIGAARPALSPPSASSAAASAAPSPVATATAASEEDAALTELVLEASPGHFPNAQRSALQRLAERFSAPSASCAHQRPATCYLCRRMPDLLVSKYAVMELLGRGGMGAVYRARHVALDRLVAIKIMLPAVAGDPINLARFRREARVLARVSHPNVVRLLDHDLDADPPWLAFEYIEEPVSLLTRLQRARFTVPEIGALLGELASGLGSLHEAGLVHRDVKPGNLLLDRRGALKIIDLGLVADRSDKQDLTRKGQVLGTIAYMAPEQLFGDKLDARADVYSFGLIAYELIAGRLMFSSLAAFPISPKARVTDRATPPLEPFDPATPASWVRLVERCLELDPDARPQDGNELARCLTEDESSRRYTSAALGLLAKPAAGPPAAAAEPVRPVETRPGPSRPASPRSAGARRTALAVLGAIAAAGALAGLLLTRTSAPPAPAVVRAGPPEVTALNLDLVAGRLHARFHTTAPVVVRCTAERGGRRLVLASEPAPTRDHDLVVGEAALADTETPRLEAEPELDFPIARPLEELAQQATALLVRLRAQGDRTPSLGARTDAPSLAALPFDRPALEGLAAAGPWLRRALAENELPADTGARLYTAIHRAQVLDHLCAPRLADGRGELRSLLPAGWRTMWFPLEGSAHPLAPQHLALPAPQRRRIALPGAEAQLESGRTAAGLEVITLDVTPTLTFGFRHDKPADRLLGIPEPPRTAASTGWLELDVPASMVAPGRELYVGTLRGGEVRASMLWTLALGTGVHASFDRPPDPARDAAGWVVARLPASALVAGRNRLAVQVDAPPWWGDRTWLRLARFSLISRPGS